jgi:hypothetical protein
MNAVMQAANVMNTVRSRRPRAIVLEIQSTSVGMVEQTT